MVRCITFYFLFTATFFLIGSYSFREVLRVWFAPSVLAGALVLPIAYRRAPALAIAAAGVAVVTLATFAAWWTWWGGYTWGPRFLM